VSELECLAYGVGHAEEGVCLLMRLGPYRVLLDCGLTDLTPLLGTSDGPPVDLILCSHAHADHARGLLALHTAFPQVPIYGSEVTAQLLPLNWRSPNQSESPLFCQALPWRTPVEFMDGLSAVFYPAGHLPGAAAILLTYTPPTPPKRPSQSYTVFYTGDFFLSNSRLVDGLPLEELRGLSPDVLIVEGSYGTSRHPHRRQQENQLAERIYQAIAQNQSVLLPTPALGLAQELLLLLRSHHRFTGRNLDIWVDGNIAAGCDAYLEILPHLPATVQNFARHQPLFWDEKVRPRVRRWLEGAFPEDGPSATERSPCILLIDATAPLPANVLIAPEHWVIFRPQDSAVSIPPSLGNPPVQPYLLSQHCDGPSTTQLIHNLRPQHILFVHGSASHLADLTGLEELHNRYQLHLPEAASVVELPVGETFLQVTLPEVSYEGELVDQETHVEIHLPDTLMTDPRWQKLADTGMVEARWQGDELVLRGLSQQDLMRQQGSDRLIDWMDANSPLRQCCANCRHYRGQRCWNPDSPLFEFKVTAEGFCPVFEPAPIEGIS
jgi:Cft2 family RNA processing exonuclease